MTTGEIMALTTVIGSVISMLGITGIDAGVVNQAVTGVISMITIGTGVWAYFAHKKAVAATPAV